MSNTNDNTPDTEEPVYDGLCQREPLVIEPSEESDWGTPLGIQPTTIKDPDTKKKFTIC